ncbi:SRPBCC family protein [Nonomuraea sp. NPDC050790]|uniref:SRPBCC family protein n=1 Tax=Nonomuraea sp. NPDC050790 TaxID=3364371 RepID=UPI00379ADEC1
MSSLRYAAVAVELDAPAEAVFSLITDWPRHREWMFLTDARKVGQDRIEAYTGIRPFGFLDTMTITEWEPPHRVRVAHTGTIVRGEGAFRVRPLGPYVCRVVWAEKVEVPRWALPAWPLVHAATVLMARRSLLRVGELAQR